MPRPTLDPVVKRLVLYDPAQKGDPVSIPLTTQDSIPVELVPATENDDPMLVRRASTDASIPPGEQLTVDAGPSPFSTLVSCFIQYLSTPLSTSTGSQ